MHHRKDSFTKGFDTDFSNTFPLTKNKIEKDNAKFDADFVKAFSDDNRNIKSIESDVFSNMKTKTVDIDEAFSTKSEKFARSQGRDLPQNRPKVSFSFNDRKSKVDVSKIWNGGSVPLALTEEEQFVWASQQSLKSEEERRKRKQEEEAELALALELSKQEKSGKL